MANLAIINKKTNIVENVIVPPNGAQAWFVDEGYVAVETNEGKIGDTYSRGNFVSPKVTTEE